MCCWASMTTVTPAAWLYPGTGAGSFSTNATKVIDINPDCNGGCSDKYGVSHSGRPFDFNFDGAMDIVVGFILCKDNPGCDVFDFGKDSQLRLYYGNGDGTFQEEVQLYESLGSHEAANFAVPVRICPWYVY